MLEPVPLRELASITPDFGAFGARDPGTGLVAGVEGMADIESMEDKEVAEEYSLPRALPLRTCI